MSIFEYIFSSNDDWANPTYYVVKLCNDCYIKELLTYKPWIRTTTYSKSKALWMKKNVAISIVEKTKDIGYVDAKISKIHWWNVLIRKFKDYDCNE